jgi:hypothetical protein
MRINFSYSILGFVFLGIYFIWVGFWLYMLYGGCGTNDLEFNLCPTISLLAPQLPVSLILFGITFPIQIPLLAFVPFYVQVAYIMGITLNSLIIYFIGFGLEKGYKAITA